MAKHIFINASVVVNGVDLSDQVESVMLAVGQNKVPATPCGAGQLYTKPGLRIVTDPVITFYQNYAAGKAYATFFPLWLAGTVFVLVVKADAGPRAVTNPEWSVPVYLVGMPVLGGTRGARHMAPVTVTAGGLLTVATA